MKKIISLTYATELEELKKTLLMHPILGINPKGSFKLLYNEGSFVIRPITKPELIIKVNKQDSVSPPLSCLTEHALIEEIGAIRHPNIHVPKVLSSGNTPDHIVMTYEGVSLDKSKKLKKKYQSIELGESIGAFSGKIYKNTRLVHSDLHPGNITFTDKKTNAIIDIASYNSETIEDLPSTGLYYNAPLFALGLCFGFYKETGLRFKSEPLLRQAKTFSKIYTQLNKNNNTQKNYRDFIIAIESKPNIFMKKKAISYFL